MVCHRGLLAQVIEHHELLLAVCQIHKILRIVHNGQFQDQVWLLAQLRKTILLKEVLQHLALQA